MVDLDPRLKVVVLEAGVIGEAAAGRNSGFLIDLPHEVSSDDYGGDSTTRSKEAIEISRTAIALASSIAAEQGWTRDIFDPCGRYSVAISEEGDNHLTDYAGQLDKLGEKHQLLDASEIAGVTGSKAYTSALFTPGTVMVQPAAYIRGVADSLTNSVSIYEQSPAIRFESTETSLAGENTRRLGQHRQGTAGQ